MYIAAGYLIEKISGLSWENFVTEKLFRPLEMNNSNFSVTESQKATDYALPCATAYPPDGGKPFPLEV
jgi:CubicO group peptidase (beta-lactamase class C family)